MSSPALPSQIPRKRRKSRKNQPKTRLEKSPRPRDCEKFLETITDGISLESQSKLTVKDSFSVRPGKAHILRTPLLQDGRHRPGLAARTHCQTARPNVVLRVAAGGTHLHSHRSEHKPEA